MNLELSPEIVATDPSRLDEVLEQIAIWNKHRLDTLKQDFVQRSLAMLASSDAALLPDAIRNLAKAFEMIEPIDYGAFFIREVEDQFGLDCRELTSWKFKDRLIADSHLIPRLAALRATYKLLMEKPRTEDVPGYAKVLEAYRPIGLVQLVLDACTDKQTAEGGPVSALLVEHLVNQQLAEELAASQSRLMEFQAQQSEDEGDESAESHESAES